MSDKVDDDSRYLPRRRYSYRDMRFQLMATSRQPFIGLTQGGSSRKFAGAKPAANDGRFKPEEKK